MKPLVTVVVPIYNVEPYLRKCVESIMHQTYNNLEILLIDDGATDGSGKICDELALEDERISVFHEKNKGLGLSRNVGIEKANGDYVTFVDSDDTLGSDLIAKLVTGIQENKADLCIAGLTKTDVAGKKLFEESYGTHTYTGTEIINTLFKRMLGSSPAKHDFIKMSVWSNLYSMDIINKYNVRFKSEREFISEDILWHSEYLKHSKCVQLIDNSGYFYRTTPTSLTNKYNKDRFPKICIFYQEMLKRIKNMEMSEEAVFRLQKQFLINVRTCIRQEKKRPDSSFKLMVKSVSEIVSNSLVKEVVRAYSTQKLGIKQRVFVDLVKNENAYILSVLTKGNIL